MRKCKIDNKKVIARNASLIGYGTHIVKAGSCFTYSQDGHLHIARSLGRISWCDNDGENVKGYVVAMVLSSDATHAFERWINPDDITYVVESPAKLAAFFFAPKLPYDVEMMRNLMAYGTTSEHYIDNASHHVEAWNAGVSPAVYKKAV